MKTAVFIKPLFALIFLFIGITAYPANCTFNGNGDGTSWSDGSNWSCGSEPDPSSDNVTIPAGFSVINDGGNDFSFENGRDLTVHGSLDMEGKKLEFKSNNSDLTVSSTGSITDIKELFFNSGAEGTIDMGGYLEVEHLKVDDNSQLTQNGRCIDVTDKLENLSNAGIFGTGCIDYTGSNGNFVNTGSGGIYGCSSGSLATCLPLDGASAMPVEVVNFQVNKSDNGVLLKWVTASESNSKYFSVERSPDGNDWEELFKVDAAGYSNYLKTYEAEDTDPLDGQNLYRLKSVDIDGSFEYALIKSIDFAPDNPWFKLYPNPTIGPLYLERFDTSEPVYIYNFAGEQVYSSPPNPGSDHIKIDMSPWPVGTYFLKNGNTQKKIILVH